jgi:CheY-like chemotaxis protein
MDLQDASILVVDDEAMLLEIFSNWFKTRARKVFSAANGALAMKILEEQDVDLIITDVRMPVMDGVTLLKKIHGTTHQVPSVIFLSGFSDVDARDAYELGAEAFIEKPVRRDVLLGAARRSLEDRDALWRVPQELADMPTLRGAFDSFDAALAQHRLAIGRGGICIGCSQPLGEGPLNIRIDFATGVDGFSGQGLLRWFSPMERMAGVELTFVAAEYRARVAEIAQSAISYIPRTTGPQFVR